MPPSGFFEKHSRAISAFLQACVDDLIAENNGVRSPANAVQRELNHISTDLSLTRRGPIPTAVLHIVRDFYASLLDRQSKDFEELKRNAEILLRSIEKDIEAVRVLETA